MRRDGSGVNRRDGYCETVCTAPALEVDLEQVVGAAFRSLWDGERPHLDALGRLGDSPGSEALRGLVEGGLVRLGPSEEIVGVCGLSAEETPHRIERANGSVNTWCAVDAIGISAAFRIDGRAVTTCPRCSRPITVTFAKGEPVSEGGGVLWLPDGEGAEGVDGFCAKANLYCDLEHLSADTRGTTGRPVPVAEAADLGRRAWAPIAEAIR